MQDQGGETPSHYREAGAKEDAVLEMNLTPLIFSIWHDLNSCVSSMEDSDWLRLLDVVHTHGNASCSVRCGGVNAT